MALLRFKDTPCPHKYGNICTHSEFEPLVCDKPTVTGGFELWVVITLKVTTCFVALDARKTVQRC